VPRLFSTQNGGASLARLLFFMRAAVVMEPNDKQMLFDDYCYLLECEMATLEYISGLKKTSQREISRHKDIIRQCLRRVKRHTQTGLIIARQHGRVYQAIEHGWDT